ncbi:hypothetical protein DTO045G8_2015 [Paecilomyces variotii]|nr:hypothetical protein DTO045G8_2015 [Paecilomyces variotii]
MSQVKQEPGSTPFIKPDPDSKETSLGAMSDDDLYEDAGDLDFSNAAQDVWLTRIPKSLWKHWAHLDDDEEIQIGTVRVEGRPEDTKRISLRLFDRPDNKDVPKDYILKRQNVTGENTSYAVQNGYVFTEKDLPGYENRVNLVFGEARSALYEAMKREARRKDRKRRWEPYVRKTIPKQTALVGKVRDEFNCMPVENEEFQKITEEQAFKIFKPKEKVRFIDKVSGKMLRAGNVLPGEKSAFVQATKPTKPRPQENKTTRMPQNELLDLIFQCFREHKYWPFSALKARLNQPETYIKQTLEMVAHLVRSGDFAMTWELKPEAKESSYAMAYQNAKEELPPDPGYGMDEEEDGGAGSENEDVQFESVV